MMQGRLTGLAFLMMGLSVLCQGTLLGKDTRISGTALQYAGTELKFLAYSNMISFGDEELGKCMVEDSGDFSLLIDLEYTRLVFVRLGVYNCFFYAEPGGAYEIRLPAIRDKTEEEKMNPYFKETSLHLVVKAGGASVDKELTVPETDINFQIRAFTDSFDPFYFKYVINAAADNVNRKEIGEAIESILTPFESIENEFFRTYMKYRLGLLKHYGGQESMENVSAELFRGQPVRFYNPAYMELFNELYANYFETFNKNYPRSKLPFILSQERSYRSLNTAMMQDPSLKNDTLREMVLLRSLYDGFYESRNYRSVMLMMIDSLHTNSSIEINVNTAGEIMGKITHLLAGYEPPPFYLYDKDSNLVSLSDFQGEYIYLNFCNSFSYHCVKEFELLKNLYARHKDRIRIITVLVDDEYAKMRELLQNKSYDWLFLHYANQPSILDEYDVKAYPSYYFIAPDKKLILSPAPSPLENFEDQLYQILKQRGDL